MMVEYVIKNVRIIDSVLHVYSLNWHQMSGGVGCKGKIKLVEMRYWLLLRNSWWSGDTHCCCIHDTAGLLLISALLLIYTALVVPVQIFLWDYSDACNRFHNFFIDPWIEQFF